MRILVTGATGFVGRRLCAHLASAGHSVVAAVRDHRSATRLTPESRAVVVGDLSAPVQWGPALAGVDCVIHLAARVHVLHETAADAADRYHRLNVVATRDLAQAAVAAGVRRLVFVSSVKAAAEQSDVPLRELDRPRPEDPYGVSKLEAERAVLAFGAAGELETVVVRPPLIYGPHVGGNFRRLLALAWHSKRAPLPLGGIRNRRSLVYVDNMADALMCVASAADAPGEVYYVTDGVDLSTSELIARLARAFGWEARLVPLPQAFLRAAGRLTGRSGEIDRLLGSLRIDSSKVQSRLGWTPPIDVDSALAATADWYRRDRQA